MEAPADPAQFALSLEAWKAARAELAAAQRQAWITGLVLGPLSFAGLLMLAWAQCPELIDFVALGGGSLALLMLWFYIGERCQAACVRAGEELRAAEAMLGQRPVALESGSADRIIRAILAVVFAVVWAWAFVARPDCSAPLETDDEPAIYANR